jgi:hypothetical protein
VSHISSSSSQEDPEFKGHNHKLPSVPKFREVKRLTPAVIRVIEMNAGLGSTLASVIRILKKQFPRKRFLPEQIAYRLRRSREDRGQGYHHVQSVELLKALMKLQQKDPGFYYNASLSRSKSSGRNQLRRVFWMSSDQIKTYQRYSEVIVHDNTAKTNRLGMYLTCFIVVDNNFKTRLVACALSRSERTDDYAWGLRELLKATKITSNNTSRIIQPQVVMIDEEAAMEAASYDVFGDSTRIVTCIWHMQNNVQRQMGRRLGKERFSSFYALFHDACKSLTPSAFTDIWLSICMQFGGNGHGERRDPSPSSDSNLQVDIPDQEVQAHLSLEERLLIEEQDREEAMFWPFEWGKVGAYLRKMRTRRFQWAGPWVRTVFTAGMKATQRVEMVNGMVKKLGVNTRSRLKSVLTATTTKVDEEYTERGARRKRIKLVSVGTDTAFEIVGSYDACTTLCAAVQSNFSTVLELGEAILSAYAEERLRCELTESLQFESQTISKKELQERDDDSVSTLTGVQTTFLCSCAYYLCSFPFCGVGRCFVLSLQGRDRDDSRYSRSRCLHRRHL